jgi:hypothetical protein
MTQNEFRDWLRIHQACFPGMLAWLSQFDKPNEKINPKEDILKEWYWMLGKVEPEDAKKASRAMSNDPNLRPKGFGDHASTVRRLAAGMRHAREANRPTYADGNKTIRCLICGDDGRVTCWHPNTHAAASVHRRRERDQWLALPVEQRKVTPMPRVFGDNGTAYPYTCARACTCEAGDPHRDYCGTYNEKVEILFDPNDKDGVQKLVDFESRKLEPTPFAPEEGEYERKFG